MNMRRIVTRLDVLGGVRGGSGTDQIGPTIITRVETG
jgi:hypothetical protein